jgi:lysophospholipase L1-like esterase
MSILPSNISQMITFSIETFLTLDIFEKLFFLFNIGIILVLFQCLKILIRLLVNINVAHHSTAYSSTKLHAEKILILGDSTAYGAGASKPEDTIAGRLAHDFPNSQIVNLAKNGALIKDLKKQIEPVRNQTFSMIIISCGGNDVLHFTRTHTILENLTSVFQDLEQCTPREKIIFLLYNNIASAPLFPTLIQYFLRKHSLKVQAAIKSSAGAMHVRVIELFVHEAYNPFLKNPEKLFAKDGIHPSSRGYELWYNRMWRLLV